MAYEPGLSRGGALLGGVSTVEKAAYEQQCLYTESHISTLAC